MQHPPSSDDCGGTAWGHGGARADGRGGGGGSPGEGEGQFEFVKARSSTSNHHHQHGGARVSECRARFRDSSRQTSANSVSLRFLQDELNWHRVSRNQCVEGERASNEEEEETGGGGGGGGNHVSAASMERLCYKCGCACSRERCPSCGTRFEEEREDPSTSHG